MHWKTLSLAAAAVASLGLVAATSVEAGSCAMGGGYDKKDAEDTEATGTIIDIASGAEQASTLVAAIKAADLVEPLRGEGPFTVLAPTNEAFAALPEGTVENLLKPENKAQLQAILKYHVIPAAAMAKDVVKMDEAPTLLGKPVTIQVTDDGVTLNGSAKVIKTDIKADNGVIHFIDAVLLPPADDAA